MLRRSLPTSRDQVAPLFAEPLASALASYTRPHAVLSRVPLKADHASTRVVLLPTALKDER